MYEKTLIILILFATARLEEISSVKNVKNANFFNSRLSTILPYLSLHNDQHLIKDNPKKSLFLLMPLSQTRNEQEKTKETAQKTKRCNAPFRKDRFLSLSAKKDSRARNRNPNGNINGKILRQNSNIHTPIKNAKYSQENSVISNNMKAEMHKDKILAAAKDNLNVKDVTMNLKSREANKCNTEKCICYCKEEKCFSEASKKDSLEMLGSSRKDNHEKINHQKRAKDGNARPNILQQLFPRLYYKYLHELHIPNLINSSPMQYYRDRESNIARVPVLYRITPNVSPYVVGKERKFVNIGSPYAPFEDRSNFLVGSNARNQHRPVIYQNSYPCPPVTHRRNRIEDPAVSNASPSTGYIDATTFTRTESDLESYDSTEIIGKDQEPLPKLTTEASNDYVGMSANSETKTNFYLSYSTDVTEASSAASFLNLGETTENDYIDMSANSETETNFYSSYSTDVTEASSTASFSNPDETMKRLEDFTETTIENQDDDPSKLTFSTDYVSTNSAPVIIYPSVTHDGKFINMKECIKLFGRDVCVLGTVSPGMLTEQTQENNLNEHSMIRIPEYVIQSSTETSTTWNNINYANKFETTDAYLDSRSFTNGIRESHAGSNENLDSTNTESYANTDEVSPFEFYQYTKSINQIYEPDNENHLSNNIENTSISIKKLMNQTDDNTMEIARNKLGKSKNYVNKLLLSPSDKETTESTSDNLYFTTSHVSSGNEEANNLEIGQENWVTNTNVNSWENTHRKEETTVINYDSNTEYNINEENRNLKEINANIYPEKKILQKQFEKESTTNRLDFKTGYNFEEEITNGLTESIIDTYTEKETLQEQPTNITTVTLDPEIGYSFGEESTSGLEKSNTETYSGNEILQRQPEKETTTSSPDFKTGYNFEEEITNGLIESIINTYTEEETLREQPTDITTVTLDPEIGYSFGEESTSGLEKSNTETYSGNEILQRQPEKETTTSSPDFKTGYNFEEEITNGLIESIIDTYTEKETLQEQPTDITTVTLDPKIGYSFGEESTNGLEKSNTETYSGNEILQQQLEKETTTDSPEFKTRYNLKGKAKKIEIETSIYPGKEILQEQPTTMQYFDNEKSNNLNNKEDTTNSFEAITDSSTRRLPFCDNTLLLNSIRKVINDFALDTRLTKMKDFDENILQEQGESLLPEVLQVSNLESILLIPRIENTIVEKVKEVLSVVTAIPKSDFTNDRSHGMIKNALRNILETFSDFHQKLPPMTVEEHQFHGGQWTTNLVTLAPVPQSQLSLVKPENLQDSIRDLLSSSAIVSQTDQHIVRNMIVQSVKNGLANDESEKVDDSIIRALNDVLQTLKGSKNTDASKKSNQFNEENTDMTFPQEISTDNHEIRINDSDSILNSRQNLDTKKDTEMDNKKIQTINYQKAKALENNILIASESPSLLESSGKDKNIYIKEETPLEPIDKIRENIRDKISDEMKKVDVQDDEEKKLAEPLKNYHKAILQSNPSILATSVESNLTGTKELNEEENIRSTSAATTISSTMVNDSHEREKNIVDITKITDIDMQNEEETDNSSLWQQQSIVNLTLAKESSGEHNATESTEERFSKYDEIDLTKIYARNDTNESAINYNLPEVSKYLENHRISDEVTATTTTFMQETSPYYPVTEISDDIISENTAGNRDVGQEIEYILNGETLSTPSDNLISATDVKYENQESNLAVTSSVDEIDPEIILERIKYNLSPIKYYSPEILKHIKNHYIDEENVKVTTATTNLMQETSSNYAQVSNDVISQNTTKDVADEMKYTSNGETLVTSTGDSIPSINGNNGYYEPSVVPSTDENILRLQQQNLTTKDNIVKIHEVTTEIQRTYAKTTYFKAMPSVNDGSGINSSSLAYTVTNSKNKDSNSSNDSNLIGNKMNIIDSITEANKVIVSSSESSSLGDSAEPFLSSIIPDNILELQKSQLYYVNDDVKLPLEIIRLKNGSYALSISKNICEQILKMECPCCVPLQGHVIQTSRTNHCQEDTHTMTSRITGEKNQENMYVSDVKINYQSTQSSNTMTTATTTRENILRIQKPQEEEEERTRAHCLWKRNMNDDNLSTISMPTINFAKKYNLLLDFNKEEMLLNETENNKIQNYDESLTKSIKGFDYNQSEERNRDNNPGMKRTGLLDENKNAANKVQDLVNIQEKTDTLKTNFARSPISQELVDLGKNSIELRKINTEANQSDMVQELNSRKLEAKDDISNINTKQQINSKNQERDPVLTKINISEEESKMENEGIKRDKSPNIGKGNVKVFHRKRKREHEIDEEQNEARIKVFEENHGRPYRYQRNTYSIKNKRAELVKSMLYWFKDLILDK